MITQLLYIIGVTLLFLALLAACMVVAAAVAVSLVALIKPHVSGAVDRWLEWVQRRWEE